jgi:hypothetical protein
MTWAPTRAVITARAIPENLLTYITDATRCRAALDWALGSTSAATYKLLNKYTTSVLARSTPVFPSIAFSDDNDEQAGEDVLVCIYTAIFEVSVQNTSPDTAATQARVYSKAISSLMLNCPIATLISGTGATFGQVPHPPMTGFLPIKTNEKQNDFLQQFQIRVVVNLDTGANL